MGNFINRYPKEVNPQDTNRGDAFSLWITSPMPMVTLVKTFNISKLLKFSRKFKLSFNMLMCWCIGKAASEISEFYLLPVQGKLYQYDRKFNIELQFSGR